MMLCVIIYFGGGAVFALTAIVLTLFFAEEEMARETAGKSALWWTQGIASMVCLWPVLLLDLLITARSLRQQRQARPVR